MGRSIRCQDKQLLRDISAQLAVIHQNKTRSTRKKPLFASTLFQHSPSYVWVVVPIDLGSHCLTLVALTKNDHAQLDESGVGVFRGPAREHWFFRYRWHKFELY